MVLHKMNFTLWLNKDESRGLLEKIVGEKKIDYIDRGETKGDIYLVSSDFESYILCVEGQNNTKNVVYISTLSNNETTLNRLVNRLEAILKKSELNLYGMNNIMCEVKR